MRINAICCCLFAGLFSAVSGAEKNVFTIQIPEGERKSASEIAADTSNILREPDRSDIVLRKPEQGTFAAHIGMPSGRIIWTPAFIPGRLDQIRVYEKIMSDDRSVLFFAEETGKGPYGTRIIAYDPLNLRCFRITELPFRMKNICPVSDAGILAGVQIPQEELEDKFSLITIDLKKNRILSRIPLKEAPEEIAAVSPNRIFLRMKDSSVAVAEGKTLKKTSVEPGILRMTVQSGFLTAVRKDSVTLYRTTGSPRKIKSIPVSGVLEAVIASPAGPELFLLARNSDSGSCTILSVSGKGIRTLVRKCGEKFAFSPESNALFFFKDRQCRNLLRLDLKTGKTSRNAGQIYSILPRTNGVLDSFYPVSAEDELVFVNVIGRPYRIRYRKGTWKKEIDE